MCTVIFKKKLYAKTKYEKIYNAINLFGVYVIMGNICFLICFFVLHPQCLSHFGDMSSGETLERTAYQDAKWMFKKIVENWQHMN